MKEQNLKIMNKALALCKAQGFSPESVYCEGEELYTPDAEAVIREVATMEDASVTLYRTGPQSRELLCVSVFADQAPTVVATHGTPRELAHGIQQAVQTGAG